MDSDREPEQFYVLLAGRDSVHDTEMLEDDPVHLGDAPRCPVCNRFVGGKPWRPPHRAELTLHGSRWGDLAFRVGDETDALLAPRLVAAWKDARLSGFSGFEPVEVTHVRGTEHRPPEYVHVAPGFGGGAVDENRSSLVRSEDVACEWCRYAGVLSAINGFSVERGTWTGDDVFIPRGLLGTVVVTPRFKDWLAAHEITNVRLERTEEYKWDSMAPFSDAPSGKRVR